MNPEPENFIKIEKKKKKKSNRGNSNTFSLRNREISNKKKTIPVKRSRRSRTDFPSGERTRLLSPKRGDKPSLKRIVVTLKEAFATKLQKQKIINIRRRNRLEPPLLHSQASIFSLSLSLYLSFSLYMYIFPLYFCTYIYIHTNIVRKRGRWREERFEIECLIKS